LRPGFGIAGINSHKLDLPLTRNASNAKFTGKNGYGHLFNFVIPSLKTEPERILQAINPSSRDEAGATAFARDRYQRGAST
jgi:hypothetical protein